MMLYLNKLYDTPTLKKGIGELSCFTIGSTSVFPSSFFTLMPLQVLLAHLFHLVTVEAEIIVMSHLRLPIEVHSPESGKVLRHGGTEVVSQGVRDNLCMASGRKCYSRNPPSPHSILVFAYVH